MSNSTASISAAAPTYPGVKQVAPEANYRVALEFDHREKRVFDLRPLLKIGSFNSLSAPEAFNTVHVAFDAVAWENGLNLDPEYLYGHSVSCASEE